LQVEVEVDQAGAVVVAQAALFLIVRFQYRAEQDIQ
jgi:hypothetical protein